ncbi:MAG TPA: DUF6119 family protein [Pyrinomonadaceae bacterium]|nr:DUF6119 family protein [Pyrinomonadaceae bacterium]
MAKTRSFSIFLLKEQIEPAQALASDNPLQAVTDATSLPEGSLLFVLDTPPRDPWWKGFFGIPKALPQMGKGALVFIPAAERWFALSFGHVSHHLDAESYEYDFGLKVTLNSVERSALKSTDSFDPGSARRRRVQVPSAADLTLFDFDNDSSILKSLTGKVKPARAHLFKNASGASNLRIAAKIEADALQALCSELLAIYKSNEYEAIFPDIQGVSPISDPGVVKKLNDSLLNALKAKSQSINLTVPAIVNYSEGLYVTFTGEGRGQLYDSAAIEDYYDYLDEKGKPLQDVDVGDLKQHRLLLVNEDSDQREPFSIYRSLIFDTSLPGDGAVYHLAEGNWYRFEKAYVDNMRGYLDPLFITDPHLIPYNHPTEGDYNIAAAAAIPNTVCLDTTNISPKSYTAVEPCDIYSLDGSRGLFRHVKVSTRSSQLSHLFNQGTMSVELLKLDADSVGKLHALIAARAGVNSHALSAPITSGEFSVRYCIVTARDPAHKSDNLPLFSRMTLMRTLKMLKLIGVERSVCFIPDQSPPKPKKAQTRKKKTQAAP